MTRPPMIIIAAWAVMVMLTLLSGGRGAGARTPTVPGFGSSGAAGLGSGALTAAAGFAASAGFASGALGGTGLTSATGPAP